LGRCDVRLQFARVRRRLEASEASMLQAVRLRLGRAREVLAPLVAQVAQLSPLKILERGYAIVDRDGKIVTSPDDAPERSTVRVRVAQGQFKARVVK
jgi:exodeoxyribonuclease VII large subunit